MEQERKTAGAHMLTMEGRTRATLTGVIAVSCFHDREIVLETTEGEIAILGQRLHMGRLNLEDGQLDVTGEIAGVEYNGITKSKERRGIFAGRKK